MRSVADLIADRGLTPEQLESSAHLDRRTTRLLIAGSYIPSPSERIRIAAALEASVDEIAWDHTVPVQHLRGNGPQTGRAT